MTACIPNLLGFQVEAASHGGGLLLREVETKFRFVDRN